MIDSKNLFDNIDKVLIKKFMQYNYDNPHIFTEFERYAREMKTHCDKSSAWLIINRIRWDRLIKTNGKKFKVSNDFIALFARKLIMEHPEFKGFFTLKPMKGSGRKFSSDECYDSPELNTLWLIYLKISLEKSQKSLNTDLFLDIPTQVKF